MGAVEEGPRSGVGPCIVLASDGCVLTGRDRSHAAVASRAIPLAGGRMYFAGCLTLADSESARTSLAHVSNSSGVGSIATDRDVVSYLGKFTLVPR